MADSIPTGLYDDPQLASVLLIRHELLGMHPSPTEIQRVDQYLHRQVNKWACVHPVSKRFGRLDPEQAMLEGLYGTLKRYRHLDQQKLSLDIWKQFWAAGVPFKDDPHRSKVLDIWKAALNHPLESDEFSDLVERTHDFLDGFVNADQRMFELVLRDNPGLRRKLFLLRILRPFVVAFDLVVLILLIPFIFVYTLLRGSSGSQRKSGEEG